MLKLGKFQKVNNLQCVSSIGSGLLMCDSLGTLLNVSGDGFLWKYFKTGNMPSWKIVNST